MPYCCVPGCSNPFGHKFPRDDLIRKAWISVVRRAKDWIPSQYSIVCYGHFKEDDYIQESYNYGTKLLRKTLKKHVVPSVFPWTASEPASDVCDSTVDPIQVTLASHCRICGDSQSANSLQPIFGEDSTIFEKIKTCVPVKITKDDGLPQNICEPCMLRIQIAYDVAQDSIKAEIYFNDLILSCRNTPGGSQGDMHRASTSGINTRQRVTANGPPKPRQYSPRFQHHEKKIQNEGSSAVAVIVVQRDAKQTAKDCLKLVLVPKDGSAEPIPERVKAALALDSAQRKKAETSYSCYHCKLAFSNKREQVSHYKEQHPSEVFECPTCEATICGAPELIHRHQELHTMLPNLNSEADMLEFMTSQVKIEVQDDEETVPQVKAIDLGIYNSTLTGPAADRQKERLIAVASLHSDIPYQLRDYVLDSLKNFLIKNTKVVRATGPKVKTPPKTIKSSKTKTKGRSKIIKCSICSRKFSSKELLEKHCVNTHRPKIDRSKCVHCGKSFSDEILLASHIEVRHSGGSYLMCDICDLNYAKSGEEQPHMTLAPVLQCKVCNQEFKEIKALKEHTYDVHEISDFQCEICGQYLKRRGTLKAHIRQVHLLTDCLCTICNKTFKNGSSYRNHFDTQHKESKDCICDMCGAVVPRRKLFKHIYSHINNKTQKKCESCNRMLGLSAWKYHKKIHQIYGNDYIPEPMHIRNSKNKNKAKKYYCRFCNKPLRSNKGLLYHEKSHINDGSEHFLAPKQKRGPYKKRAVTEKKKKEKPPKVVKPKKPKVQKVKKVKAPVVKKQPKPPPPPPEEIITRECEHCRKVLNLDVWNYHQLFHELFGSEAEVPFTVTGNMAYLHKLCSVRPSEEPLEGLAEFFPTPEDTEVLKREKKRLTSKEWGRQMVPCKICSKLVKRYSMDAHLRTHKEKDSLECDFCKKIFSRKLSLTTHMKLHLKIGGHECTYCGKYLRSPSMLVSHEAAHRGERNYKCPFCPKSFPGIHHVQNHIGNVHHKTRKARP